MIKRIFLKLIKRARALGDMTFLFLVMVSLAPLLYQDAAATKTLIEWAWMGLAFAGLAVFISRVVLPQIDLTSLLAKVEEHENTAAAIVIASVLFLTSCLFLGLVIWAKV